MFPGGCCRRCSRGPAQVQRKVMSNRTGVSEALVEDITTRYCRKRPPGLATVWPLVTADQSDQLPSGVAVLPLRVCTVRVVPAGTVAVQLAAPQVASRVASKTAEVKMPLREPDANCTSPPELFVTV